MIHPVYIRSVHQPVNCVCYNCELCCTCSASCSSVITSITLSVIFLLNELVIFFSFSDLITFLLNYFIRFLILFA
jgi:hypothetical protein